MNFDEEDIQTIRKSGARVRSSSGDKLEPLPEKPTAAPSEAVNRSILSVLRGLAEAIGALSKREGAQVHVAAPSVTVKPEINLPAPARAWTMEIVEWTADKRAKKWKVEEVK